MFKRIYSKYFSFICVTTILVACQTASEQAAYAKPPISKNINQHKAVLHPVMYNDTLSKEGQLVIHRLDSFYKKQTAAGFNGSVLIAHDGKISYKRHFGWANRETKIPLGDDTPSQLASTSKPFTATAILLLHQNKYLNIDDPVKKYLKDFPYDKITITMLLNHRSGLPDYVKMGLNYWKNSKQIMYNEDLLQIFAKHKPKLNYTPNTRFQYSNSNYAILARVIEEVSELNYAEFIRQFIFEPLGMQNSFIYDPLEKMPSKMTISYKSNWVKEPDMFADGVYGDKGIYSTVEDLLRWDQSFYNNSIISARTAEMAFQPYSFERAGTKNYGLGWRLINYADGYKVVYHNGWWHGNNTVFYRFVVDNFTIIILGNKYNSNIYAQAKPVFDIVKSCLHNEDGTAIMRGGLSEQ